MRIIERRYVKLRKKHKSYLRCLYFIYLYAFNLDKKVMAKRRDLKKIIDYLSGELIMEALLCSLRPKYDKIKIEEIISKISNMNTEFKTRIQHPSGNSNKRLTSQYYNKLRDDFDAEVDKIYMELLSLNKVKVEN